MNRLILFLLLASTIVRAQDVSPIVVDLPNSPKLQWNGSAVKQRGTVLHWQPVINGTKDFYIKIRIQYWSNNAGAYGSPITSLILADTSITNYSDVLAQTLDQYKDRYVEHQSSGVYCDNITGRTVSQFQQDGITPTVNAVTEAAYWQQFKLNQVSGVTSIATQGAFDSEYKIIKAIVVKMSSRKNW